MALTLAGLVVSDLGLRACPLWMFSPVDRGLDSLCLSGEHTRGIMQWGCYYATSLELRLILNTAVLAASSPTLLFRPL